MILYKAVVYTLSGPSGFVTNSYLSIWTNEGREGPLLMAAHDFDLVLLLAILLLLRPLLLLLLLHVFVGWPIDFLLKIEALAGQSIAFATRRMVIPPCQCLVAQSTSGTPWPFGAYPHPHAFNKQVDVNNKSEPVFGEQTNWFKVFPRN